MVRKLCPSLGFFSRLSWFGAVYPVHVPGAKFSGGDLHFSQGDGEITFCGAIEMGGVIDFGVDLIKSGMAKYGVTTNPVFMPETSSPDTLSSSASSASPLITLQTPTTTHGRDGGVAERLPQRDRVPKEVRVHGRAGPSSARFSARRGISGIVGIPNACCTGYVPTAIFDFDIRPNGAGPTSASRAQCAVTS
jgi:formamidase